MKKTKPGPKLVNLEESLKAAIAASKTPETPTLNDAQKLNIFRLMQMFDITTADLTPEALGKALEGLLIERRDRQMSVKMQLDEEVKNLGRSGFTLDLRTCVYTPVKPEGETS